MVLRLARFSGLLVAGLLAGAVAAAPAAAAFGAPFNISPNGEDAFNPQVGVDDDGDAVFVWQNQTTGRVQARARSSLGVLSGVQTLSASGQEAVNPQVGVDADGDAVFVWQRSDGTNERIQTRARSAAGALTGVQTLSGSGQDATGPQVAVDDAGDAVFAWTRFDGSHNRVQAQARDAAGNLSARQNLSAAGESADSPQVGIDFTGDAVFTWRGNSGQPIFRAQTRAREHDNGDLSPVQNLSPDGQIATAPQVAVHDGGAVFTWLRSNGQDFVAQTRARSDAGTLSKVNNLSAAGQDARSPQVAVNVANGNEVFTWERSDGTDTRVQGRARSAGGTLSAVQNLSAAGQDAFDPQVGVEPDSDAVFVWQGFDTPNFAIQARTRSAVGNLGAVQDVSPFGAASASVPRVAIAPSGSTATATWTRFDGTTFRIQGARGP
jgi:hypothetical protein